MYTSRVVQYQVVLYSSNSLGCTHKLVSFPEDECTKPHNKLIPSDWAPESIIGKSVDQCHRCSDVCIRGIDDRGNGFLA